MRVGEETAVERTFRRSAPSLWPDFAVIVGCAYGANILQALVMPRISTRLAAVGLLELYRLVSTIFILSFTVLGLGGLVACYYFALREQRIHTSMSETGLALRAIAAGVLAAVGFVVAIHINAVGISVQ